MGSWMEQEQEARRELMWGDSGRRSPSRQVPCAVARESCSGLLAVPGFSLPLPGGTPLSLLSGHQLLA